MPDKAKPALTALPHADLRPVRSRFSTLRAVSALVLREMSTTYGRSPGGYVWAILEPAAGIALLTAIFSAGFRNPPLGSSFALFYATGMLPFLMFMDVTNKTAQTIQFSRQLLEYPRITFVDALLARILLSFFTQLMLHSLLVTFIVVAFATDTLFDFRSLLQGYALVLILGAGLGTMNSFLTLAYPLWQTVWAITTRPLFLISAIIFVYDTVPKPYSDYLWYNPLIHIIGVMRDGYFPFYHPNYVSFLYVICLGMTCGLVGLFLLHRYHRDILDK